MEVRRGGSRRQKQKLFSHQKIDVGSSVCSKQAWFKSHSYVQMEKEEGSFVRADVPFLSEPQPRVKQSSVIVETHLSYSERDERKHQSMAEPERRLREVAPWFSLVYHTCWYNSTHSEHEQLHSTPRTQTIPVCHMTHETTRKGCVFCDMWAYRYSRGGGTQRTQVNSVTNDLKPQRTFLIIITILTLILDFKQLDVFTLLKGQRPKKYSDFNSGWHMRQYLYRFIMHNCVECQFATGLTQIYPQTLFVLCNNMLSVDHTKHRRHKDKAQTGLGQKKETKAVREEASQEQLHMTVINWWLLRIQIKQKQVRMTMMSTTVIKHFANDCSTFSARVWKPYPWVPVCRLWKTKHQVRRAELFHLLHSVRHMLQTHKSTSLQQNSRTSRWWRIKWWRLCMSVTYVHISALFNCAISNES